MPPLVVGAKRLLSQRFPALALLPTFGVTTSTAAELAEFRTRTLSLGIYDEFNPDPNNLAIANDRDFNETTWPTLHRPRPEVK